MNLKYEILSASGKHWIIAFYGFGQDANFYKPLATSLSQSHSFVVIDLPYEEIDEPINKGHFIDFVKSLQQKFSIDKISGISFSMGSRFNLVMAEEMPESIEALYLIAPDGIRYRWWTSLATNTFLGHQLFKFFCYHPSAYLRCIHIFYQMHIMPKALYTFSKWHMRDLKSRQKVYHSWMNLRKIKPNLMHLRRKTEQHSFPIIAYFGSEDPIINASCCERLKSELPKSEIIVLNKGHNLADEDLFSDIATRLIC